tara:strand:+ start:4998 stop:6356 length:1359 start_codon:yes stop_codon:yes gene_type:complete
MNKIKQNKITFILILTAIVIIFSSLTILSLPVLFNYKSKVAKIEKNFYYNFKLQLKSSGKIVYKPFPKPHLLVESATINLPTSKSNRELIKTSNLKIFISIRDVYLSSFRNFISTEISKTNIDLDIIELKEIRKHFYQKINKPIFIKKSNIFFKNNKNEVVFISPLDKISYKINTKSRIKSFIIDGKLFGLNFVSDWKRDYDKPKTSVHIIDISNPNIEIKNFFEFINSKKFKGDSKISYSQDRMIYNYTYDNGVISINSPDEKNVNFKLNSNIQTNPFHFDGEIIINNKKIEKVIDNFLSNLFMYNEDNLGNLSGNLKIKFNKLNNKLIKKGEIEIAINEKKLILKKANFELDKIGNIMTNINFVEDQGEIKFISQNTLDIKNHIEFAKTFQIASKKAKKINQIYFDLEKLVYDTDVKIKNVRINNIKKLDEIFIVSNIQNLRSFLRKLSD